MKTFFLPIVVLVLLSGCASEKIYYWGHYEELIYTQYQKPGEATPEAQVDKLQQDIQIVKVRINPSPQGFMLTWDINICKWEKQSRLRRVSKLKNNNFLSPLFL